MKVRFIIYLLILFIVVFSSCKKEPNAPVGGNKIEMGGSEIDTVSYFEAQVSSALANTGGNEISQHGHCWSTKSKPTTGDTKTSFGKLDAPKSYTSQLTDLENNTAYYIRSYVTYPNGTVYGTEEKIKTLKTGKPVVNTTEVSNVTLYSAQCSGNVLSDSGLFVTTKGICWDTTNSFTITNCLDTTIVGDDTGSFISNITALNEGVKYFVKAYATNEKGTSYGELKQFSTVPITVPEITTTDITEITINSAKSGGNVTSNGTVTTRGVCWNTTGSPTLENNIGFTTDGNGIGLFTSQITELIHNTIYYIAAYATNEKGTGYGEVIAFQTIEIGAPSLSTANVTVITTTTAKSGGIITDAGNGSVTNRGVCWSTFENPTIESNMGMTSDGSGIGTFSSSIAGLTEGTQYYVRAYATNDASTSYGEVNQFSSIAINIPQVVTSSLYDLTSTSVSGGGTVTNEGNSTVISKGLCWSTSPNPTIENNYSVDGSGIGGYSSNINDLLSNTEYYLRAYATNSKGTGYGAEKVFTTLEDPELPIVITINAENVTYNSAEINGNVTDDGNSTVSSRGFCWSINPNPTLSNNYLAIGSGLGNYSGTITGLNETTLYYVRSFAINEVGIAYGNQVSFNTDENNVTCGEQVTYEGQVYNTVLIGNQCWFKENLNIGVRINGSDAMQDNQIIEKYCYNDNETNCNEYGGLYQWGEIMNYVNQEGDQGICPDGWNIPSFADWVVLANHLGGENVAGGKLKESGNSHWNLPNTGASNESGFTALPGGYISEYHQYQGDRAFFWTSTTYEDPTDPFYYDLEYNSTWLDYSSMPYGWAFAVRCIKNN